MISAPARRSWAIRIAGLAAVLVFLGLVARFWHPVYGFTAFFQLDASNDDLKLAEFRELPVYVHRETGGYDGLYYAQIALDPTLRNPQLRGSADNLAYRARRILPPALAWLLGAGRPAPVIFIYSVINIVAWLALAALLWRIFEVRNARGWLAWAGVMFSAGALSSVRLALSDLPALAILAGAIFAAERWHGRLAVALLAAAGLARETALLGVAGLCKRPWFSVRNIARVVLVLLPLALWLGYIRWRVGGADQGWSNFNWPVSGLIEKWQDVIVAIFTVDDHPLAWTTLLATIALTAQLIFIAAEPRFEDRWWRIGAVYSMMMLCLGTAVWEGFPGAATRVLLPLTLAFNLVAHRVRARLAWLIIGNLSVFSGLLAMRDVPADSHELAAIRRGESAVVARFGEGWFGREHHGRHTWFWTRDHATLVIECWGKQPLTQVQLELGLRGINARTVTVHYDGREVGRATIGETISRHAFTVPVKPGINIVTFATDSPPVKENASAGARELAFALYDPRLALPQP